MASVTRWRAEGESFITREGRVSMLGISEAAEDRVSEYLRTGELRNAAEAPLPCIVHWNQQHFVVVYRTDKKHVWVADPGAGKLKYTRKEFCRCWLSSQKRRRRHGSCIAAGAYAGVLCRGRRKGNGRAQGLRLSVCLPASLQAIGGAIIAGTAAGQHDTADAAFLPQSIVDFGITAKPRFHLSGTHCPTDADRQRQCRHSSADGYCCIWEHASTSPLYPTSSSN